jgi:hypothetical protein
MSYSFYHVTHLISVFILVGILFWALSDPDSAKKKPALKWSGIASLVALIAGFGLLARLGVGFPIWVTVKLVCWLVLTGLVGMAYKMPEKRKALLGVSIFLISLAVVMVSLKPF